MELLAELNNYWNHVNKNLNKWIELADKNLLERKKNEKEKKIKLKNNCFYIYIFKYNFLRRLYILIFDNVGYINKLRIIICSFRQKFNERMRFISTFGTFKFFFINFFNSLI